MKEPRTWRYAASTLSFMLLIGTTGCSCISEMTFGPTASAENLEQGRKASAAVNFTLKFRDSCCPSSADRQLLFSIKSDIARLSNDVLAGRITTDDYNKKVASAKVALDAIAQACGTRGEAETAAWENLERLHEELAQTP